MVAIPFPLSSSPGTTVQEAAGRLINCQAVALGDTARARASYQRVPGMSAAFATSSSVRCRGMIEVNGNVFAAIGQKVLYFSLSGGAMTIVGTLVGTDKVTWARNNKKPTPDIVVVTADGAFTVTTSAVTAYADADLPIPNSVCFLDGFFIYTLGDGRLFASGLNAVTQGSNDFTTAEAKPDGLTRGIAYNGLLWAFGPTSCEIYADTANPTGFPFSRQTVINRGLLCRSALAGHEDGFGKGLIFVADDNTVCRMDGYTPNKISPPDLDALITGLVDKTELEACVYTVGGHAKWALSCSAWTWEFNYDTQKWNERQSNASFRWRASCSVNAFGKWLVGDTLTGNVFALDPRAYDEAGDPLPYIIESGPVQKFPSRIAVARADFDFSPGTGIATGLDPIATDPTIEVSWSRDGGTTWGNPLLRKLGRQAMAHNRITVTRAGLSTPQGHRWRLKSTSPVPIAFMQGAQSADIRTAGFR